jgi:regulator of protease activity HflC (stomatin/prohibitin superfamily)
MELGSSLGLIGWALIGLLILYVFYVAAQRAQRREAKVSVMIVLVLLVGGLALNTLGAGLVFIQPQERGVVISALSGSGYRPQALGPGLHWVAPYVENVIRYSISNQTYTMVARSAEGKVQGDDSVSARTADGQLVYFDASVIYAADPAKVVQLHIQWQGRYEDEFVRPRARSLIYNRAAQFTVEQIYGSKRTELQVAIQEEISKDFEAQGLKLVQFLLRNISFSPEYAQAVEQKQIAQQNAERAKFLVQQQEQEAARIRVEAQGVRDAAITRAEGEAKALTLVADALRNNPDLIQYTYVQKIAPNVGVIVLPGGGGGSGAAAAPYILDLKSLLEGLPKPVVTPTAPVTTTVK